jgi:hypothetical protein
VNAISRKGVRICSSVAAAPTELAHRALAGRAERKKPVLCSITSVIARSR